MAVHKITLDEAAEYHGTVLAKAIREGAIKGLYSAALRMVNEIQTQIIPQMIPSPVDRGVYKAGWRAEQTDDGALYENTVRHAGFIEDGVKADSVKVGRAMIDNLAEWAARHGADDPIRAAFAIAISAAAQVRLTTRGGRPIVIDGGGRGFFNQGQGLRIMAKANERLAEVVKAEVAREVDKAVGG